MPYPIINLTPEAQAKINHLNGVMDSARISIDAVFNDKSSYKNGKPFDSLSDREISNLVHGREADDDGEFTASSMGAAADKMQERTPGSHPELKSPEVSNVHAFQPNPPTSPMKLLKQRLDSMSSLQYEARTYKSDGGMVVVMAVGEYPICLAADMDEAKTIIDALAAHAGEN